MNSSVAALPLSALNSANEALTQRLPTHFMSRYRMVSFTHLPYAYCLQRGRAQDALLESLLAGKSRIEEVDIEAAVVRVRADLPPLPL